MDNKARNCQTCDGVIPAYTTAFTMRIQLFAEGGTLYLTPDDLAEDHTRRMEELIEAVKDSDPQEALDEVHESFSLTICSKCRKNFHDQFNDDLSEAKDL